ncbi:hypothetical protein L2W58_02405 [Dethiosulfovibrio sp. F2B]|uniref:hypothetical protein n=1 Tax=Dethiosulfovibrio faecalis TaxID=2720018 RepID=UPI001F2640C9|nr:hypothetical protein [Dethiosulfovibrio faecalis]MCF4150644.1 hypothetical protein [Dethiosulfovibrio faecalis]
MDFDSVKNGLRRLFLSRVSIHKAILSEGSRRVAVSSATRSVDVHPLRSPVKLTVSRCAQWRGLRAKGKKLDLFISPPKARGGKTSLSFDVSVETISLRSDRAETRNGLAVIARMPLIRRNRVHWLRGDRRKDLMAVYYPIIKDSLLKSALEKESGDLYIWYNSSCQGRSSRMLCLVSDPGKRPPLAWKWI